MEGKEILAVVDSVSSEKGLEKDVIFEIILSQNIKLSFLLNLVLCQELGSMF